MVKITNIIWVFNDTEFEGLDYKEAVKLAALPKNVKTKEIDEEDLCEELIQEFLEENYGFEVEQFDYEE